MRYCNSVKLTKSLDFDTFFAYDASFSACYSAT